MPEYLKRGWKEKKWQRIARFRLDDNMRGNKWEKKKRRKCRDGGRKRGNMYGKSVQVEGGRKGGRK